VQGDAHLPIALTQGRLQFGQNGQGERDILDLPLRAQGVLDPFEITRGGVHVGLFDLDQHQPRGRVHCDRAGRSRFAHDLPVHLAFGRDINHDVPLHRRLTAKAATLFQPAHAVIAFFDRIPF